MGRPPSRDWTAIRRALQGRTEWMLLGKQMPYSTVQAITHADIPNSGIPVMSGVEVRTRNSKYRGGKRYCDVYLRLKGDS